MLLILAGVTIATLTGDNEILTQANNAKEQTEIGEEKEKIKLVVRPVVSLKSNVSLGWDDTAKEWKNSVQKIKATN